MLGTSYQNLMINLKPWWVAQVESFPVDKNKGLLSLELFYRTQRFYYLMKPLQPWIRLMKGLYKMPLIDTEPPEVTLPLLSSLIGYLPSRMQTKLLS